MQRWQRLAGGVLALGVAAAGTVLGVRTRTEAHRLLTNPIETRSLPRKVPLDFGMVYDEASALTTDGLELAGWYVPSRNGAVVIAQHGYKGDRGEMLNEAAMLARHGYGVLLSSVRAHDMSDGRLITFGRREIADLQAWYEWLVSHGADPDRIAVLGNSMGGSLVIGLAAANPRIRLVIANSPFSSLADTVETSIRFFTGLPPFPFAPLITFWAERTAGFNVEDVDAKAWIRRVSPRPVLIMQGGSDVVVSRESGRLLYEAAGEPKELWFEPAVGHTGFDTALAGEYEGRVVGFLDRYLLGD